MKKRFVFIGCLLLFPPHAVLAAQESAPAASTFLLPLLLLLLSAVAGWLCSRLRRLDREKKDISIRLQLAQQALDQAPMAVLWVDSGLKIVQANQAALQSAELPSLIGIDLLTLNPKFATHPVIVALQSGKQKVGAVTSAPVPTLTADQGGGQHEQLTLVAADTQKFAIWYGSTSTGGPQRAEVAGRTEPADDKHSSAVGSANRMKSEFIANINHEIRTPMNAIIGYAEMLISADLAPREKRFVTIIHKSSLALVSIFNDIMELSKIDSGRVQLMFSSVRLQSIIDDVEGLYKEQAFEKELRFRCHIAPHLPQILILDGARLKQVLQNLVSNAIKFTAKGFVELMVDGEPSANKNGCVDLRFKVEDSGIGIPDADQKKIFELLQQQEDTISRNYGGIGLGLTLCSRLVSLLGGRIELVSAKGSGARFTVFLNAIKVAEQASENLTPTAFSSIKGTKQKLLIVDDVDLIKDVFVDFFQNSTCKVLTANNGEEALAIAVKEKPGIIFMDLNMIGMDGRTVTEHLRKQPETAAIPVVVMTGEILEEADYRPLFDDFLQKPFRLEALREMVARYIPFDQADAEQPPFIDNMLSEEQDFLDGIAGVWTEKLEMLRCQAVRSGSLADAVSLGAAMLQAGGKAKESLLSELGGELVQYAAEPNILGVDRLLAKLARIADRKHA